MTKLNQSNLTAFKMPTRARKLSSRDRLAMYAFFRKGVPTKILAKAFGVNENSIRYTTRHEHTGAHYAVKTAYEELGEERVWRDIVTDEQTRSINALMGSKR